MLSNIFRALPFVANHRFKELRVVTRDKRGVIIEESLIEPPTAAFAKHGFDGRAVFVGILLASLL